MIFIQPPSNAKPNTILHVGRKQKRTRTLPNGYQDSIFSSTPAGDYIVRHVYYLGNMRTVYIYKHQLFELTKITRSV
jgi:hypothetical protein